MKFLVAGYWIWFAVSIAVIARRSIVRRGSRRENTRAALEAPLNAPIDAGIDDVAARVAARLAEQAPPVVAETAGGSDATVASSSTAPERPEPSALPSPTRSAIAGERKTLAEVLHGITMPSDLAPLVHLDVLDQARRAVFATNGRTLDIVNADVATELERLGFVLQRLSPTETMAQRGDDTLRLRTRAIGLEPKSGPADPMYPTAGAGSVVLDVELT